MRTGGANEEAPAMARASRRMRERGLEPPRPYGHKNPNLGTPRQNPRKHRAFSRSDPLTPTNRPPLGLASSARSSPHRVRACQAATRSFRRRADDCRGPPHGADARQAVRPPRAPHPPLIGGRRRPPAMSGPLRCAGGRLGHAPAPVLRRGASLSSIPDIGAEAKGGMRAGGCRWRISAARQGWAGAKPEFGAEGKGSGSARLPSMPCRGRKWERRGSVRIGVVPNRFWQPSLSKTFLRDIVISRAAQRSGVRKLLRTT